MLFTLWMLLDDISLAAYLKGLQPCLYIMAIVPNYFCDSYPDFGILPEKSVPHSGQHQTICS